MLVLSVMALREYFASAPTHKCKIALIRQHQSTGSTSNTK